MMQVVAHNLLSQFTNRQLNIKTKEKAKTSEKLSSGYRINRSADDAAGLKISEKMRQQIRGLHRGAINIQEGVSLINTADGALSEVHGILQRVRELTVQAYNDTNNPEDREAIQSEIDAVLQEVDRIADTTTFNGRVLLKGNPMSSSTMTVGIGEMRTEIINVTKDIPSWLNVDKELTVHTGYTQMQDTSGVMKLYDGINDDTKQYYGPEDANVPGGYEHLDTWTQTIEDNPSAKVDFSGLTNVTDAADLYSKLFDLIGCKISFPCGTCSSQVNSICFGGDMESLTTIEFAPSATIDVSGDLNLSDTRLPAPDERKYFEAIQDLLVTYADNYDNDSPNEDKAGEAAAVKALAETIAKDIRDKVLGIMDAKIGQDHFDRVVKGNDDYSFIVYDFRDDAALTNRKAADATVNTTSRVTYRIQVEETEGTTVTVTGGQPLKIQCSSGLNDSIDIFLPSLSLRDMKLYGYQIYMYRGFTEYSEAYQEKLKAWEDSAEEEVHTVTYMAKVIDSQIPPIYGTKYVNGEAQKFLIQAGSTTYKEEERTHTYSTKKYGPKPDAEPGDIMYTREYAPDSLWLVDNAISMVSAARAGLGATHNRLEHAYNIDTNSEENTQAAESRIRDADMAKEMVEYSKNNLLAQAGQSMLAQANQSNQGVLSLLQ